MEGIMSGAELFAKGGMVMYVLLACSVFAFSIGIERLVYFSKNDSGREFARNFCSLVDKGDYGGAIGLAKSSSGALSALICDSMRMMSGGFAIVKISSFLEMQSGIAIAKMRRRLYYLNVIVTMAPLLGLLGTISGMISAFSVFNAQASQATAITGGVGEALIATAMGLGVAIISLIIYSYFNQRLENVVTDMEQCFSYLEHYSAEFAEAGGRYEAS